MVGRVLAEVARSFANFRLVATLEAELLRELSAAHEVTATVPYHPGHVTDLQGLLDVGAKIWGDEVAVATERAAFRAGLRNRGGRGSDGGPPPGTSSVRDADGSTEGRKPPSDKPESDAGS
jgi:hypothetical protein